MTPNLTPSNADNPMVPIRIAGLRPALAPLLLLGLALAGGQLPPPVAALLAQALLFSFAAVGVGVLDRFAGFVSFGHATWFALPAYAFGILVNEGLARPEAALPAALAIGVAAAGLVALLIVRVPGIAFSMLTLALGQAVYELASKLRGLTGGADGLAPALPSRLYGLPLADFQTPHVALAIAAVLLAALLLAVEAVRRSRWGVVAIAIRENEERARYIGIPTLLPRVAVFAASAAIAGLGGLLFVLYAAFISLESLHWSSSGVILVMALLGGLRSPWGPVAGALAYFLLRDWFGTISEHWLGLLGISVMIIATAFPDGLAGLVRSLGRRLGRAS